MAVLSVSRSRQRLSGALPLLWLTIALGVLVVPACVSLMGPSLPKPWFPHAVHAGLQDLSCTMCHGVRPGEAPPSGPTPELCAPCHDQVDADKAPEDRVAARFDESGRFVRSEVARLPEELRFSHRAHMDVDSVDCQSCHPDPDRPRASDRPLLGKRDCMGCHAQREASNDCGVCHESVDRGWVPESHGEQWKRRGHGQIVRDGLGGAEAELSMHRCDLCHDAAASCQACHVQEAPESHDNHFRLRGHGVMASLDRSRCAVCHKQDSCQQCHQETRPMSHRGGFGSPTQRHCTGCHFPLQQTGCYVCHKATPEHEMATPLPAGHNPSMNCRLCHGNGQALPHPDGGHSCTLCHK